MPFQADPATPFPMIKSDLAFTVLEATFDVPAAKGNVQQFADGCLCRSVAEKVFYLAGERVVTDQQVIRPVRQSAFVSDVNQRVLDAPHQWAFLGILDAVGTPRLSGQRAVRLR